MKDTGIRARVCVQMGARARVCVQMGSRDRARVVYSSGEGCVQFGLGSDYDQ